MRQLVATLGRYRSAGQPLLLVLIAAALCALAVSDADRALARLADKAATPALVEFSQALIAATFPIALILFAVLAYRRAALGALKAQKEAETQCALVALAAGLAAGLAEILQPLFGRTGPEAYLAHGVYAFHYFRGSIGLSTFPSVFAGGLGAIAAASWMIVPAYRPTVILLAAVALGCQVVDGTHFLADQIAGLAIGWGLFEAMRRLGGLRNFFPRNFN